MDRNNRYAYVRRQGQQHHNHQHQSQQQNHSPTSLSSNNNQHLDNHRNSSGSSGSSTSQYSSTSNTNTSAYSSQSNMSREPLTQHDELIRYIREAWNKVSEQGTPVIYQNESEPLKNFKPFNLEEYWGQRLVQNIHVSHGHQ